MNTHLKFNSAKIINELERDGFAVIEDFLDIKSLKQLT